MILQNGLRRGLVARRATYLPTSPQTRLRAYHYDSRNRLTSFWTPTQTVKKQDKTSTKPGETDHEDAHNFLLHAGFVRQAHSGIFHLLPLGLRVQNKIEALIDRHMRSLGASKVSLSSLSAEELWERSGRLEGRGSEFFRLSDRKDAKYLLAPTHEEEITNIVANAVQSYKDLPLRLYQVSRKYRDEARPRQGLLRGREFVMKDLYTFDATEEQARETYEAVRKAYAAFFNDLRMPYLVAAADSGNMGGNLSHEYHFVAPNGEDTIISCDTCDYSINEELYVSTQHPSTPAEPLASSETSVWTGISKDHQTLIHIAHPGPASAFNLYAAKAAFPSLDLTLENPQAAWKASRAKSTSPTTHTETFHADPRIPNSLHTLLFPKAPTGTPIPTPLHPTTKNPITFTKATPTTPCPACTTSTTQKRGTLTLSRAIEIGHTFHLSTRYTSPLSATALSPQNRPEPIQMGCHGLGVSRLIAACASLLASPSGLNWPLAIAPFHAVVISTPAVEDMGDSSAEGVYDTLQGMGLDVILDDRARALGWKLKDADLIGYPFILVLGKGWLTETGMRTVEVQCRRLGVKEQVGVGELEDFLDGLRGRL